MRKKVMLSAVFGMVLFTIAVTIVRGAISGGLYRAIDDDTRRSGMDLTWECVTFWFHMELTVGEFVGIFFPVVRDLLCLLTSISLGFLIACLVSYRALFSSKNKTSVANVPWVQEPKETKRMKAGMAGRLLQLHHSLVDTCRTFDDGNLRGDIDGLNDMEQGAPPLPVSRQPIVGVSREDDVKSEKSDGSESRSEEGVSVGADASPTLSEDGADSDSTLTADNVGGKC